MSTPNVLLVDDEVSIREMLRFALEAADFECAEAGTIQEAYAAINDVSPDIVLLDWMLPGGSGIELLRRLRNEQATKDLPIIMLTARTEEDNVVQALDMGANDYITKPFSSKELIARIKATLRKSGASANQSEFRVGELALDTVSHRVTLDGAALAIGPTEFKLLHFFMANPDHVHSRTKLLNQLWGHKAAVQERTVDVHIRRLRKILQNSNAAYSELIQTVSGAGYRFSPSDLRAP